MEILLGCGTSVAAEASNSLLAKIKKHVCFVFSYDENIKILEKVQKKLNAKITDADKHANDASHRLEDVSSTVTLWQEEAHELRKAGEIIMSHHANSRRSLCPNPWSRYSWSKKAWELTQEINENDKNAPNLGTTFAGAAQNVGDKFNLAGVLEFDSRSSILNGVLEALKDDKVSMCSICGMGGVGKTTLAMKLVQRVEADRLFYKVAMVTVTQSPNIQAIQSEIIEQMGLEIDSKTMPVRASQLNGWLVGHKTLLVLDDVWRKLNAKDFGEVGIPLSSGSCKIVLTSRNEDECIAMGSQRNFCVGVLEDKEALKLFREMAGISYQRFESDDDPAKKIALECGGLPIAIITIATGLKGKQQSFWNDSLVKLQNPKKDTLGVYSLIQVSYDLLDDEEAKACFRLCCLYPEDHNIPVQDLVLYGKGLQMFDDVETMAQARNRVDSIVYKLKKSFMLLEGHRDDFVKMHDTIRDFAIFITSKHEHPYLVKCENASIRFPEKTEYENCSAISIESREIIGLPDHLQCKKLKLLQLNIEYHSDPLSDRLLEGTEELQVLSMNIPSIIESLDVPKKLRTLRVNESGSNLHWKVRRPTKIWSLLHDNLKSLESLSISTGRPNSKILEKIGWLSSLRFLDLSGVTIYYLPPGTFSKLVNLEELYLPLDFVLWGCPDRYDGEKLNAGLNEIESLQLNAIKIGIPSGSVMAEKFITNLTKFHVYFGLFCDDFLVRGDSKQLVEVYDVEASDICGGWIRALLQKCERLSLINVRDLKNIMCQLIDDDRNWSGQLKEIFIRGCNEIEYLADDAITDRIACYSELQTLELVMLHNLKEIISCSRKIEEACFSNLSRLKISFCDKLKHVFPISLCRELRQLQSMVIYTCEEMEAIFYRDELGDGNGDQVAFSSITEGKIEVIQTSPKTTSNQKPKSTTCPNPCSIIPGIFGKKKQSISVPNDLQVEDNTPKEAGLKMDALVFAQLKTLTVMNMPKLRILYEGNEAIEIPSLQELIIRYCDSMEALSYGSLKAPRLQNVEINDIKYLVEGDLNPIVKNALRNGDGENEIRTCN